MQIWQGKGSVQGVCGPQKRGEARVLWPSKEQVEEVEMEDEYQHWIIMNNKKIIKTNWMLTSQGRGGYLGGERLKKTTDKFRKETNTEVTTFYLFQIYVF